ncbi:MAG: hypothetical protein AAFY19_04675 [Pseudomonadota bacterium]
MSILDASLARTSGTADTVTDLAKELKLDAAMVEKAIMALSQASISPGDTVARAASQSGLSSEVLSSIVTALGGETGLGVVAEDLSAGLRSLGQGNFFRDLIPGLG